MNILVYHEDHGHELQDPDARLRPYVIINIISTIIIVVSTHMHICIYVHVYLSIYRSLYIYIHIYIHIYIYIYISFGLDPEGEVGDHGLHLDEADEPHDAQAAERGPGGKMLPGDVKTWLE